MSNVTPNVARTLKAAASAKHNAEKDNLNRAYYMGMWVALGMVEDIATDNLDEAKREILAYMPDGTWDSVKGFIDMVKEVNA